MHPECAQWVKLLRKKPDSAERRNRMVTFEHMRVNRVELERYALLIYTSAGGVGCYDFEPKMPAEQAVEMLRVLADRLERQIQSEGEKPR